MLKRTRSLRLCILRVVLSYIILCFIFILFYFTDERNSKVICAIYLTASYNITFLYYIVCDIEHPEKDRALVFCVPTISLVRYLPQLQTRIDPVFFHGLQLTPGNKSFSS